MNPSSEHPNASSKTHLDQPPRTNRGQIEKLIAEFDVTKPAGNCSFYVWQNCKSGDTLKQHINEWWGKIPDWMKTCERDAMRKHVVRKFDSLGLHKPWLDKRGKSV